MERTFFPRRDYWLAFEMVFCFGAFWLGLILLGLLEEDNHLRSPQALPHARLVVFWWVIAISTVYVAAAIIYAILAYHRKRLIIREEEICSHGPLSIRVIRFADVIEARWLWMIGREHSRERPPYGLRLRTATKELMFNFNHFVQREAQSELVDWFRSRLGRGIQNWEMLQALREGRASLWGPTVFTIKTMSRMLVIATGLSGIVGAAIGCLLRRPLGIAELWADAANRGQIGAFLQIRIPAAAERLWSGSLLIDWGLGSGILGLIAGILFLSGFWYLEWTGRKWRSIQGRRSERAVIPPLPEPIRPSPESRGG